MVGSTLVKFCSFIMLWPVQLNNGVWFNSNVFDLADDSVGFCLASAMMMIVFEQLLVSCGKFLDNYWQCRMVS